MNNDAKDAIGRLRAINMLLLMLRIDRFDFPLDDQLRSVLTEHRPCLLTMVERVADLAHFGETKDELLSCTDDILDPTSNRYYTREYLDMLLSLYRGSRNVQHIQYENIGSVRAVLTEACCANVSELLQSIIWLRIAFDSCYPDVPLIPLRTGWVSFCELVIAIGGKSLDSSLADLINTSMRSWRFSEAVVATLSNENLDNMPHKNAFLRSFAEVETILQNKSEAV